MSDVDDEALRDQLIRRSAVADDAVLDRIRAGIRRAIDAEGQVTGWRARIAGWPRGLRPARAVVGAVGVVALLVVALSAPRPTAPPGGTSSAGPAPSATPDVVAPRLQVLTSGELARALASRAVPRRAVVVARVSVVLVVPSCALGAPCPSPSPAIFGPDGRVIAVVDGPLRPEVARDLDRSPGWAVALRVLDDESSLGAAAGVPSVEVLGVVFLNAGAAQSWTIPDYLAIRHRALDDSSGLYPIDAWLAGLEVQPICPAPLPDASGVIGSWGPYGCGPAAWLVPDDRQINIVTSDGTHTATLPADGLRVQNGAYSEFSSGAVWIGDPPLPPPVRGIYLVRFSPPVLADCFDCPNDRAYELVARVDHVEIPAVAPTGGAEPTPLPH